jgi:mono/diheme cytochrome c family protein
MRRQRAVLALMALLALGACKRANMYSQAKSDTYDRSRVFADGSTMRPPVAGTVARNAPDAPVPQPARITAALLARGRDRYGIYCAPCHGVGGNGHGIIIERGFPEPPPFSAPRLRAAPASHFYSVISNGTGRMFAFDAQLEPEDRWAIVAYIRALQLSQHAVVAELPASDAAQLAATK